jgi:hypothetical protein
MTAIAQAISRLTGNEVDVDTLWTVTLLSLVTMLSCLSIKWCGLDFGDF